MAKRRNRKKRPRRPSRTLSHTVSLVAGGPAGLIPWVHLRHVVENHQKLVAAVEAYKPARTAVACGQVTAIRQQLASLDPWDSLIVVGICRRVFSHRSWCVGYAIGEGWGFGGCVRR